MLPVRADVCEYPYCTTNNDGKAKSTIVENIEYRILGLAPDIQRDGNRRIESMVFFRYKYNAL
jgi:hypothetical protein